MAPKEAFLRNLTELISRLDIFTKNLRIGSWKYFNTDCPTFKKRGNR